MFYGERQECLAVLKLVGRESCQYGGPWPDNICDCKFGVKGKPMFHEFVGSDLEQIRDRSQTSEQTGCPEIRSIYRIIEKMTDAEWDEIRDRSR